MNCKKVIEISQIIPKGTQIKNVARPKTPKIKDMIERYQDLLEIARLVSWCTNRDYLIETCLDHISKRLGKRARCCLMEGEELKLQCWVGRYKRPIERVPICKESIVWKVVEKGVPLNLTDPHDTDGYRHTLGEEIKIKAIIPLWYVDPLSQEERRVGALIVDSGKEGVPISSEDFEYLKVVGELIGAATSKAELVEQLEGLNRRKEAMVRETAHAFRNRIAAIGILSRRIAGLAKKTDLAHKARMLRREVQELQVHLRRFEKYMGI
jgi:GAF domain-containing protein